MYKVEYLILLKKEGTKCKTVKALKNLLKADSDIKIDKQTLTYNKFKCSFNIKLGNESLQDSLYFNLIMSCKSAKDIKNFSTSLKAIRNAISLITPSIYVIWDDLNLYYAQKAYPIIFEIENQLRKLISKFMLTNIGVDWTKERIPKDVSDAKNSKNQDINYLNNIDFIKLSDFLFSENYPTHKESLIKELKQAKDLSSINLEQIQSLLPVSNWDKYFTPIVDCEGDYLKKRWQKLYDYRNSIAHNKKFTLHDLNDVIKITDELKPIIFKAINNIDGISLNEDEKEKVSENVMGSLRDSYGDFIQRFKHMEFLMNEIRNQTSDSTEEKLRQRGFGHLTARLRDKKIINEQHYNILKHFYYTRNNIVHRNDLEISNREIKQSIHGMEAMIRYFRDYINKHLNGE